MSQTYHPGTEVEYYSTSLSKWIPARVLRNGKAPGSFDLDCKDGVDTARIRPLPRSGSGSATSSSAGSGPGGGPLGLREGEPCFYRSSTHGWISAQAVKFRPEDRTYDLDVKQQVTQENIRAVRPGDRIEYHSTSSNTWIPAQVLRKGATAGTFDLDCKDNVHMSRLRPPKDEDSAGGRRRSGGGYNSGLASLPEQGGWHGGEESAESQAMRQRKLDQLRQATRSDNPEDIKKRLESTSALSLVGEEDLDIASHKLWQMQAKPEAQADLRKAIAGHNSGALEAAIEAAVAVGVAGAELDAARQALKRMQSSPLWRYDAGDGHHIDVRAQPKIDGPRVKKRLESGDIFCVSEERPGAEGVTFLQLADGRGWLFDRKPGVGVMCKRYVVPESDSPGTYMIIHDQTAVTPTEAIGESEGIVSKLSAGTIVKVLQVVNKMSAQRIRGRIESPAGWISLLDTAGGLRWAVKHKGGGGGRSM
mmetsp:Transcript_72306/g.182335  ORF Transcript_72306/g.182335 Transcript_72306/m.182335 type:complete len:476 (+) Transcript_72306:72-1499(+)